MAFGTCAFASMTDEIVTCRGSTEFRPAPDAPIIDNARVAHERLEPLRLAHRRISGSPKIAKNACLDNSRLDHGLRGIDRPFGGPDVKIDPSEPRPAQRSRRRGSSRWRWGS